MHIIKNFILCLVCVGCSHLNQPERSDTAQFENAGRIPQRKTRGLSDNKKVDGDPSQISFKLALLSLGPKGKRQTKLLEKISLKIPEGWHLVRQPFVLPYVPDNHLQNYYLLNKSGRYDDWESVIVVHPRANRNSYPPVKSVEKLVGYPSIIFDHYPGNRPVSTELYMDLEVNGKVIQLYKRNGSKYLPEWHKIVTGKVLGPYTSIGFCLASKKQSDLHRDLASFEELLKSMELTQGR